MTSWYKLVVCVFDIRCLKQASYLLLRSVNRGNSLDWGRWWNLKSIVGPVYCDWVLSSVGPFITTGCSFYYWYCCWVHLSFFRYTFVGPVYSGSMRKLRGASVFHMYASLFFHLYNFHRWFYPPLRLERQACTTMGYLVQDTVLNHQW